MTEEAFKDWLVLRGRTPEVVRNTILRNSARYLVQQAKEQFGETISLEEAEKVASLKRLKFVQDIAVLESGGAVWNEYEQQYMFRSEFGLDE